MSPAKTPLVWTIRERCRVCYTCVRECPAKAIRIAGRKAEVIPERCVACGHCVRVCSQQAKEYMDDIGRVQELLADRAAGRGPRVAICLAPSFPAEFHEVDYELLIAMLRRLGFDLVCEVSFGADLVAAAYRKLLAYNREQRYIATTCPALVGFVERYHPDLVPTLAPLVSPMIALARALRKRHGALRVVFVGPCIAKKGEATSAAVAGEIDAVLTFVELRKLLALHAIRPAGLPPSDFDGPRGAFGALFPIHRGLLQSAGLPEDLITGDVVATGRSDFVGALQAFENGDLSVHLLEALCCDGCVMGPATTGDDPLFRRRDRVSRHVRRRMGTMHRSDWDRELREFADLDLTRTFAANDQRICAPSSEEIAAIMARMGKRAAADELNCGACGYSTCQEHAIAIWKGLAESEMCLPYTIDELRRTCGELTLSNQQLASTQEALMQSEKLASMGQLAAGIAHEVNNPLGTVLMLAHVLLDEARPGNPVREDLSLIVAEADRCKKIVSGLLQFARRSKVEARRVDLGELARRAVRSVPAECGVATRVTPESDDLAAEIDGDQIMQVLVNLVSNAVAAMPRGGALSVRMGGDTERVWFAVQDTGVGIPRENRKKIFEPFFTTKPPGQGTGLGLAVTYGIVKMHHGDIRVESNADPAAGPTGTTFTVTLPRAIRRPGPPPPAGASAA